MLPQNNLMFLKTQQLKNIWNGYAPNYNLIDSSNQTFYYTLINMLNIKEAKHILEIGCGTGKMIPHVLSLKDLETTYLATDISQKMIEVAKNNLEAYINKIGVHDSIEDWFIKHNLTLKVANADDAIESPHKFDRIIANMLLMIVEDSVKMMKSLHDMAEQGCLLGISILGNPEQANLNALGPQAMKAKGAPLPKMRPFFYLYNKLQQLATQTGWEIIVQWQQNAPLSHTQLDKSLIKLVNFMSLGDQFVRNHFSEGIKRIFKEKKVLNIPVQMAILRKK